MKIAKACRQAPTGGMRRGIGDSLFREALEAVTKPIGIERHCFQKRNAADQVGRARIVVGIFRHWGVFLVCWIVERMRPPTRPG